MNREGKSFRHRKTEALVVVVKSKPMSAGTTRHTVLVLDPGSSRYTAGSQSDVDEVPVEVFTRVWELV